MCVKCKYTKCRLVGFIFGSYLGWFKNLMYLGLLSGCGLLLFLLNLLFGLGLIRTGPIVLLGFSVLIWIRVGLAWAKWVKVFGLGCSYLKIPWAIKDGDTRPNSHPLMNRVCQQLNYNQVEVCCFVGFVFSVSLG